MTIGKRSTEQRTPDGGDRTRRFPGGIFCCLVIASLAAAAPAGPETEPVDWGRYQQVRYVSVHRGSDDAGDGTKSNPWRSIGYALSQAGDAGPRNRYAIVAAQGSYREAVIPMREYVDLFGGFEPETWRRDIWRYATVLDGAGGHRVLVGADHARIDGFEIRRGVIRGQGAGLFCDGASPVVSNNRWIANKTLGPKPWKPAYYHEPANDGGAISCVNGAAPVITNNLFAGNQTEIGRGGAISLRGRCAGRIANNVFIGNRSGTADPMRSSDGGAISIFDWSRPVIENNIILGNRALRDNDGGGVFVALWSSPLIRNNIFVGNASGDDAGALFVGGQEHRYDSPLDPLPPRDAFFIRITENVFFGNRNPWGNSGAMRFTMESRGLIANNIMAHNTGFYIQRSEATVVNNTILENVLFVEAKAGLEASVAANNIIWGETRFHAAVSVTYSNLREPHDGAGNISAEPRFVDDWIPLRSLTSIYDRARRVTEIYLSGDGFETNELVNRVMKAGPRWGVVKSNRANRLIVWGDVAGEVDLMILPTYRLRPDSPGVDKGALAGAPERDIDGDPRPSGGGIDMGADEVTNDERLGVQGERFGLPGLAASLE